MLSKLRRWLREGLILLALLAGAMLLMDAWRAPQLPASFDSTPLQTLDGETVTLAALSKDEPVLLYFWGELVRRMPLHDAGSRQAAFGRGKCDDHCVTFRK